MSPPRPGHWRAEVRNSRSWRLFILMLHAGALAAVVAADLSLWPTVALLSLPLLSLLWDVQRRPLPLMGLRHRLKTLVHHDDGNITLIGDAVTVKGRILPESRLWSRILFLRLAVENQRVWLVLPADALSVQDFRRLQVRLRLHAEPG